MGDRITLECANCGGRQFKIPSGREPKPDDMIECAGCGRSARYDKLQAESIKKAKSEVSKIFGDIFKK